MLHPAVAACSVGCLTGGACEKLVEYLTRPIETKGRQRLEAKNVEQQSFSKVRSGFGRQDSKDSNNKELRRKVQAQLLKGLHDGSLHHSLRGTGQSVEAQKTTEVQIKLRSQLLESLKSGSLASALNPRRSEKKKEKKEKKFPGRVLRKEFSAEVRKEFSEKALTAPNSPKSQASPASTRGSQTARMSPKVDEDTLIQKLHADMSKGLSDTISFFGTFGALLSPRKMLSPRKNAGAALKGEITMMMPTVESLDSDMVRTKSLSSYRASRQLFSKHNDEDSSLPQYVSKNADVPIIIVTSEVDPFSKSGALALTCQSYGIEFSKRGHRTMVVSPMYDDYPNCELVGSATIWLMGAETEVKFFHQAKDQGSGFMVDYLFVSHPCYRRPGGLYVNEESGLEYEDNLYRFALFSLAALEVHSIPLPTKHGYSQPYGQRVVFVASDWQAALLPVYVVHRHRPRGEYREARCIFALHNLEHQGVYPLSKLGIGSGDKNVEIEDLGLDPKLVWNDLIFIFPLHERQHNGDDGHVLNLTKAAFMTADLILTVSPGYASEIKTEDRGFRLHAVAKMRESQIVGILNGIDDVHWNPMTDKLLAKNYGPSIDFIKGRATCKKHLQERLALKVDPDVALVAFVGGLTYQKGIDVILQALDWLMADTGNCVTGHVQLILMGHGDSGYENDLRAAECKYKASVCGYVGFDPDVEHMIYGGSDFLVMPSRYEPCGLQQMCAMRYGCVPIVTATGGLKDSVVTDPPEEAIGFVLDPLTLDKFQEVTYNALEMFHTNKREFQAMQVRGMRKDFSWCHAFDKYEQQIDELIDDHPESSLFQIPFHLTDAMFEPTPRIGFR